MPSPYQTISNHFCKNVASPHCIETDKCLFRQITSLKPKIITLVCTQHELLYPALPVPTSTVPLHATLFLITYGSMLSASYIKGFYFPESSFEDLAIGIHVFRKLGPLISKLIVHQINYSSNTYVHCI